MLFLSIHVLTARIILATIMIFLFIFADTVEALLMKTLVNGQLYLWPPS